MPIANCIVTSECHESASDLVEMWAAESGQSSEHMTVNIVASDRQFGNRYSVMATLYLPTMWSNPEILLLQLGLAKALAQHYGLAQSDVHVITCPVHSGMVVESGEEVHWR